MPRRVVGTTSFDIDDRVAVYRPDSAETLVLSGSLAEVWRWCDGSRTQADIAGVCALACDEVEAAVATLSGLGVVEGRGEDMTRRTALTALAAATGTAILLPMGAGTADAASVVPLPEPEPNAPGIFKVLQVLAAGSTTVDWSVTQGSYHYGGGNAGFRAGVGPNEHILIAGDATGTGSTAFPGTFIGPWALSSAGMHRAGPPQTLRFSNAQNFGAYTFYQDHPFDGPRFETITWSDVYLVWVRRA
jgi:hypothetical protein